MSKKKVSGSTMTLKDFHGGSIPSDLTLPSAPSITVRSSDRSVYERASSWGRLDNRSRPHISPATRNFDVKTPFLNHNTQIGKNFDEDERTPLDGVSAPRRTIGDNNTIQPLLPSSLEVQGTSYSARFTSQNKNSEGVMSREHGGPYVWAVRKEVSNQSTWSVPPDAVSNLAHASALDKVSSGLWHSKTAAHQAHAEVVASSSEVEEGGLRAHNGNGGSAYNRTNAVGEKEHYDAVQAERGLSIDNQIQGGRNEEVGDSKYSDVIACHGDGLRWPGSYSNVSGSELSHLMPSEPAERPKLKLQPRTKALESSEPSVSDYVQVPGQANFVKPVSDGTESGKELGQRPKLNLKPRSQPLDKLEGNTERDRSALFGGARPRELVLKERGLDDVAIHSFDVGEHSNRIEHGIARPEKLADHSTQTHYGEKNEGAPLDRRTGKKIGRKEQRVDVESTDAQRRNWSGDNQRKMQDTLRQQQVSERQPSPETWRKPAEQPKPSLDAVGVCQGKAASAVELAHAFSRSVSADPKVSDRFSSGQTSGLNTSRGAQLPFSRLVGPTTAPRPQINGY